ncbi:MAG: CDP-diacylglycerol--glycerol-3-phosphate 3-phosphatidyltransferase [Erysipelotrichales bacterium]|nr:CDP-diacylglycerol--glycerol-3-phosphate 3-phosphatidyltransferase [Erysipelotrichales bacterium]MBQ1385394.1 CDP-diacylglycerol--glycerol-3-phosphate 3-phosphatidyltransferase [Erysipelotrichales bacterium]MBQ4011764.1 CDP-diacylglycerol--glycerol-3-phosphate 3-phosphatidyltransferase [Erysipelotrichales bacterium]MBQ4375149.1 CDP-diacylglycerol--glycerol-3-phosphate 3-phosphatidyltransferase [Erysipelotrichales bacterium]
MTTANKLTLLRIALIPVFLVILYLGFPGSNYAALAVFIIASLTDLLDGYIARHYNQITNFGKFMDPLADKVLVLSAMCWFVENGQMPGWCLAIVLFREFAVSGMRLVAVEQGKVIAAAWSGKIKTASTMVCLCLMMLNIPSWLNLICIIVIVATTVYSGIEYFIKNAAVFKNAA